PHSHPHPHVDTTTPQSPPDHNTLSLHDALPISTLRRKQSAKLGQGQQGNPGRFRAKRQNRKTPLSRTVLAAPTAQPCEESLLRRDRKSTRLNSSHLGISYAVFCLKKKKDKTKIE